MPAKRELIGTGSDMREVRRDAPGRSLRQQTGCGESRRARTP